jgi:hypothetical protein
VLKTKGDSRVLNKVSLQSKWILGILCLHLLPSKFHMHFSLLLNYLYIGVGTLRQETLQEIIYETHVPLSVQHWSASILLTVGTLLRKINFRICLLNHIDVSVH